MSKIKFNELPLSDDVLRAIDEMGFTTPSKIQEKAIPEIIKGRDLIGQAQTGTGKTLAFGSALLSELHHSDHIQAIVLSPTRELASQIYEQFKRIGKYTARGDKRNCIHQHIKSYEVRQDFICAVLP